MKGKKPLRALTSVREIREFRVSQKHMFYISYQEHMVSKTVPSTQSFKELMRDPVNGMCHGDLKKLYSEGPHSGISEYIGNKK